MKIEIEATDKVTKINGVLVRLWEGKTEAGIPCKVFVHRIAVDVAADCSQFEKELEEKMPPGRTVSLREVL